ncbi:MAG: GNAT family N-acetyltransferase [Nocardioidaceae bacterium]
MFRCPVHVRDAVPEDVSALLDVWGTGFPARADREAGPGPEVEGAHALARIAADPDQRVLVVVIDEVVIGAVHLYRAALSPLHSEQAVHVSHLHVLDQFRRHGVGRALMEAAVTWAEEKDSTHVLAAASFNSRDANRFMARLGLAQVAVVRGAAVAALRAKLPVEPPAGAGVTLRNSRNVGQVLAQRRSLRRAQSKAV